MRAGLRWALAASLVFVVVAQWWPQKAPVLVRAVVPALPPLAGAAHTGSNMGLAPAQALPASLSPLDLGTSGRDPFVPQQAMPQPSTRPPLAPPPAAATTPQADQAPAPRVAMAPQQTLRYLGFFSSPTGATVVMLADGETAIPVSVGSPLPNGYVVQSLGPDAVRLLYAPTATVVDIPLPAAALARR